MPSDTVCEAGIQPRLRWSGEHDMTSAEVTHALCKSPQKDVNNDGVINSLALPMDKTTIAERTAGAQDASVSHTFEPPALNVWDRKTSTKLPADRYFVGEALCVSGRHNGEPPEEALFKAYDDGDGNIRLGTTRALHYSSTDPSTIVCNAWKVTVTAYPVDGNPGSIRTVPMAHSSGSSGVASAAHAGQRLL